MGVFANPGWLKTIAWGISLTIIILNLTMLASLLR
jgi:Mn2+/Fe2+ NRAMP family transporter